MSETVDLGMESVVPLESKKPGKVTGRSITSLSADTIKRNYPKYVVNLSPGREGIKVGNALKIAAGEA